MNTTHNPIPQHFELAYHNHRKTRVCFFINKRIGSSQWSVTHHTPDFSTLEHHLLTTFDIPSGEIQI